jgi:uncharacterized damage-inducible protein DinB
VFLKVKHFLLTWARESAETARVMAALSDESLGQRVAQGSRTLGELAWHVVVSQREILGKTGLKWDAPAMGDRAPTRAAEIQSTYVDAAKALAAAVELEWTDETLKVKDRLYDQEWSRGVTLMVMLHHEIHHRGQMTVLMRQAGLKVPGVCGPSADEE